MNPPSTGTAMPVTNPRLLVRQPQQRAEQIFGQAEPAHRRMRDDFVGPFRQRPVGDW